MEDVQPAAGPAAGPTARLDAVARAVAGFLGRGLAMEPSVVAFVESTLGGFSPGEAAALLGGDDPEGQGARELLLFPDMDLRLAVEAVLGGEALDRGLESALARRLAELVPRVEVAAPGEDGFLLDLDEDSALRLVSRLKVWRGVPPALARELEANLGRERALRTMALLRQARFPLAGGACSLVAGLARAWSNEPERLARALESLGPLLEELEPEGDPYAGLMARKRAMAMHLRQGDFADEARSRNTFETLMAQGLRLPHVDREGFARAMDAIDEVCLAVYGRTEYFGRPLASTDHGRFKAGDGRFIELFLEEPWSEGER